MITDYKDNILHFDKLNLLDVANTHQTPFYLYSENIIEDNFNSYLKSFGGNPHIICYSVKANSNLSILSYLAKLGSGFDIVSAGELSRVIYAGGDPQKTVFSGVGKTEEEIQYALDKDILCFNIESEDELVTINNIASKRNAKANISIRVNPDINVETHPYITTGMRDNKFGIEESEIISTYIKASKLKALNIIGIDFHIGSQILDTKPYVDSLKKIFNIIDHLRSIGIVLSHLDIGGGLGITYNEESAVSKKHFISEILKNITDKNLSLIIEPGRSIVGDAGLLITKVVNIKKTSTKNFAIMDAGMNDLMRPPLYDAFHTIKEIKNVTDEKIVFDVVGPICESADFIGKERKLFLKSGDFVAIENVGAYGFVLASNYNTRPKIDEYIISNSKVNKIRDRETINQILENELKFL